MAYSRANPSPRYIELQDLYRTMHEQGERFHNIPPEATFAGLSLKPQALRIKRLIERTGAQTILDYGSGKGRQYELRPFEDGAGGRWPSVLDYWNVEEVVCYDPCYAPFSKLPGRRFDGVICTDVLEHCPEEDMAWIIDEIFGFATRFLFANVACFPALKLLPNGENTHCTIKPLEWWKALIEHAARRNAAVIWQAQIYSRLDTPEGPQYLEQVIGNA